MVSELNLKRSEWEMLSIAELKGLYKSGAGTRNMTPLLETSGWYVWISEALSFNFTNGYDFYSNSRAFAVRSRR
jgi:hypothetical protein